MKLEVGKRYMRGDGKVGTCQLAPYPFTIQFDDGSSESYTPEGKYFQDQFENDLDLIRPADEPAPLKVEVGKVYEDGYARRVAARFENGDYIVVEYLDPDSRLPSGCKWMVRKDGTYPHNPQYNLVREVPPPAAEPSPPAEARPVIEPFTITEPGEYRCVFKTPSRAVLDEQLSDGSFSGIVFRGDTEWTTRMKWRPDGTVIGCHPDWNIVGRWKEPTPERGPEWDEPTNGIKEPAVPPTPQPWDSPEDVPMPTCWIRFNSMTQLVVQIFETGIGVAGGAFYGWKILVDAKHTTDGREWAPCVKGGA